MNDDATLHDARLQELARRLGTRASERLDVERIGQVVVERLRTEPRAEVWVLMHPSWLRIAAALVILVGAGVAAPSVWRSWFIVPPPPPVATAGGELGDLSADQLRELLGAVGQGQPSGEQQTVSWQDVGLEDLSAPQLRALLVSLEG
jgi:hypothetical protein